MGKEAVKSKPSPAQISSFLQQQKTTAPTPELKECFAKFEDFYDRKLWHQLTLQLEKFVNLPNSGKLLVPLYENFIVDFEKRLNSLSLVQYLVRASREFPDAKKSHEFLSSHAAAFQDVQEAKEAYVLAKMEAAHYQLLDGDAQGCKASIDECGKILDSLPAVEPIINASFYRVSADYYKAKAQYHDFYKSSLLYLASLPQNFQEILPKSEQVERAHDLALSALLADNLYNFGELLMHPILQSLNQTEFEWLKNLVEAFNRGDMVAFDKISSSPQFKKQGLLVSSLPFLGQKLHLMTLIENVFKRSKNERGTITFDQVAKETRVHPDEVEHLIMRALSLGLIKGNIDQVEKVVNISWVQPRTLDKNQIKVMMSRLGEWSDNVQALVLDLEAQEGQSDLLVQ